MIRTILSVPLWFLRLPLALFVTTLDAVGRRTMQTAFLIQRLVYYPLTRAERRLRGEPLWKPIDAMLGISAPEDYPRCRHGVPQGVGCHWCDSGQEPMEMVVSEVEDKERYMQVWVQLQSGEITKLEGVTWMSSHPPGVEPKVS